MRYKKITSYLNTFALQKLFFSVAILYLTACSPNKENKPSIILIPENYIGSLHIIFDVPKGQPPQYENENKTRIYEMPPSGVLLTQMVLYTDKLQYYYVDSDGKRTKITKRITTSFDDTPENRLDTQVYIFGGGIAELEPVPDCKAKSLGFAVGTKSDVFDVNNLFGIYDK